MTWSLAFNRLLMTFCNTLYCVCLVRPEAAPARLPPQPSILGTRSTAGGEKVNELSGPTRPLVGEAGASTRLQKIQWGSRSARSAFSS